MIIFKHKEVEILFNRSKIFSTSNDPYARLLSFEKALEQYLENNYTSKALEEYIHTIMALVNMAQIQVKELKLNVDLDGDGKIGGKKQFEVKLEELLSKDAA